MASRKRLSQLESADIFALQQGQVLSPSRAVRLVKRGLASWENGKLVVSKVGQTAFYEFMGMSKVDIDRLLQSLRK